MTKSLKNLSGRFRFRDRGVLPSGRLLIAFALFSVSLTFLFTLWGIAWRWVFIINALFLAASLLDLFFLPTKKQLTPVRTIQEEMERGITYTAEVTLKNASRYMAHIQLKDDIPRTFRADLPLTGEASGQGATTFTYDMTPSVRGKYEIDQFYIRYRSIFGLWKRQMAVDVEDTVKVIPDLTETKQYLENAQRFLLYEGAKIRKYSEGSGEFAQIRNYAVGDDTRKINWRKTAKLQEVMINEYEPEHGKYITILIDCGRMMGAELSKGNRLDKVLDAAMVTVASALKNGDSVAVIAFSKGIKNYIPPAKGMAHLKKILQSVYALEAEPYESNYPEVLRYLETVHNKRSLILLFSDIHTFLHEQSALVSLRRLRKRHLFLMIGIKDKTSLAHADKEPTNVRDAMVKSVAQEQINIKKHEKLKWEAQGLLLVEANEESLAATAVSRYIQIMNQGLL